jgi:hypothetical protein
VGQIHETPRGIIALASSKPHETGACENPTDQFTEMACLHIASYLASWGMYRGSGPLYLRSILQYEPIVGRLARCNPKLWSIDADRYDDERWDVLASFRSELISILNNTYPRYKSGRQRFVTDLVATKILLGVFGSVPALDRFVIAGFHKAGGRGSWLSKKVFEQMSDFYAVNKRDIDEVEVAIFGPLGRASNGHWTKAKVIDAVLFVEGGGVDDSTDTDSTRH